MYDDFGTLAVIYSALSLFASSTDAMKSGSMREIRKRWAGPHERSLTIDIAITA